MIGVDEVGRGCWAGPLLVVAARPQAQLPAGLKDSKLLSRRQRLQWLAKLTNCCQFGEGWIQVIEIDKMGLALALRLGVRRALLNLKAAVDEPIIMDGKINYLPKKFINSKAVIDADNLVPAVSAASIYAKVSRDRFMSKLAAKYPAYNFEKNVGYGTFEHRAALAAYGYIRSVHRTTYAPIAAMLELSA